MGDWCTYRDVRATGWVVFSTVTMHVAILRGGLSAVPGASPFAAPLP